jgi:tRNA-modifying protein YgfZ
VIGLSIDVVAAPDWVSVGLSAQHASELAGALPDAPGASVSSGSVTLLRWWGADRRFVALGPRTALPEPEPAAVGFHLADIRAGLPEIHARTSNSFVPQMLNLDVLNAVSYTKGCYVGQEVVARARRAGIQRRMQRFGAACPPPVPGTRVMRGESDAGEVVGAAACATGCELLAVVDVPREPLGLELEGVAASTLTPLALPYALGSSPGAVAGKGGLGR